MLVCVYRDVHLISFFRTFTWIWGRVAARFSDAHAICLAAEAAARRTNKTFYIILGNISHLARSRCPPLHWLSPSSAVYVRRRESESKCDSLLLTFSSFPLLSYSFFSSLAIVCPSSCRCVLRPAWHHLAPSSSSSSMVLVVVVALSLSLPLLVLLMAMVVGVVQLRYVREKYPRTY